MKQFSIRAARALLESRGFVVTAPSLTISRNDFVLIHNNETGTWRGFDFRYLDLHGADFRKLDLTVALFSGANLEGADFRKANVSHVAFRNCKLKGADFRDAILEKTTFNYSPRHLAKFSKGEL
jgi:uncharacterized protein YjbI with pentapeptide repeats